MRTMNGALKAMRTGHARAERPVGRLILWIGTALITLGILCASPALSQSPAPLAAERLVAPAVVKHWAAASSTSFSSML